MSRFVLTAQLQLQAPTNTAQIVRQIQSQLNNVQVNIQVQGTAQATRQVQQVAQSLNAANSAASNLGRTFAVSVRRFAALAVATRAVSLFTNTLADAVQQSIDFERQLVKLSQVTGQSLGELRGLTTTITQLATGFGVTSKSLLDVSTVLLQAGLNSRDTEVALKSLAKAALAPNFDSISETAEGAIAILAQFQQGVGALETQLSSINAVAGAFAVEAGDLIDVIRRTGGVFKASGGSLNELLALFTSVRATTRESAESIGTGLRTIFTRIQRPQTIEFLKQFGIELVNLEGKFVGPFEAVRLLSGALAGLGEGDLTFIRIAEELGGFRQIGKVLPLLQQFSTAQSALAVAQKANNGLTKDAETAQQALAIRITKVKEEFLALVRGITETSSFQLFANTSLNLASALIRLADALKPIIPLLTAVATIRMAQGIGGFLSGFGGGLRSNRTFNQGGKVLAFARGGMVPGTGNRDTVPAMLSPGEFVIRKSSVSKLGAGNLAAMNENRFAVGGLATQNQAGIATPDTFGDDNFKSSNVSIKLADIANATPQSGSLKSGSLLSTFSNTKYVSKERPNKIPAESFKSALQSAFGFASKTYIGKTAGVSQEQKTNFTNILNQEIQQAIKNGASSWSGSVGVPLSSAEVTFGQNFVLPPGVVGSFFESIVDAFEGRPIAAEAVENKRPFDFMSGLRGGANSILFSRLSDVNYIDAKKSASLATDSEYKKKISSQLAIDGYDEVRSAVGTLYNTLISQQAATPSQSTAKTKKANLGGLIKKFATGGGVGTDTVPALLTPGEFVVNKKSAQSIGYGTLGRMNKVGKYASGGIVRKFAAGGRASGGGDSGSLFTGFGSQLTLVTASLQAMIPPIDENSGAMSKLFNNFLSLATTVGGAIFALEAFNIKLTKDIVGKLFTSGKGGIGDIFGGFQRQGGKTVRTAGESFTDAFGTGQQRPSINAARSQKAQELLQLRSKRQALRESGTGGFQLFDVKADIIKAKKSAPSKLSLPKSLTGQFGNILGQRAAGGGILGRAAGLAGRAISGVGGLGGGAIGGLAGGAIAAAGPIAAVTGIIAAINSAVGTFRDLDGQLKKSIEAGDEIKAMSLAAKNAAAGFPLIGNLIGGFSDTIDAGLISIQQAFGGSSLASIQALAASQAGAVKTQKQLVEAQKTATNAMEDFQNGTITAAEALAKIRAASSEVQKQEKRAGDFAIKNLENRAAGGFTGRNVASFLTLGMVESSSQRNNRLGRDSANEINQAAKFQAEAFQMETAARTATIRSGFARGSSREEIRQQAVGNLSQRRSALLRQAAQADLAGDDQAAAAFREAANQITGQIDQIDRELNSLEKEVARAKAAFEAMNLGLRGPTATATAMSASMDKFAAGLEVGGSTFVSNTEFLSQAVSSAAQAMDPADIKSAIDDVANNLQSMGVDPAKFRTNTEAFIKAQQDYNQAFKNIKDRIKDKDFQGMSADSLKSEFAKELTSGLGDEAKKNLTAIIENLELSEDEVSSILAGNVEVFGEKLGEAGKKQFEQIMKIAQERNKAEQVVIGFIKQRAEAERNLAQAQKEAVDLYMEGRDIQAKYGGASVSEGEKRGAILARANAGAGAAGLTGLKTGNAAELRARNAQIFGGFRNIEAQRSVEGGMQGRAGAAADEQQKNIQQAQKDQVQTIRDLIKLEEENLKLIQEKNRLEKDSIDSLISGDITKFFEQQAAVGAQAAIAIGSDRLQGAFGSKALGMAAQETKRQQEAGVQELFGQRLAGPGGLTERAYGAAVGSMGITDPRMARMAAGTTGEEEAIKGRLQELGGLLGETGALGVAMAEMQVQTATINVSNAELKLAGIEERGREAAAGMYRGGVVYANRGIFVPRGTDTVPAMLTPGEFVVRREAVQRGNNLQLLQAMNKGQSQASSDVAIGMARGGIVRYRDRGSSGPEPAGGGFGISTEIVDKLAQSLAQFNTDLSKNIERLSTTNFNIKLDTTNINVNLTGTSFLNTLKEDIKKELMTFVGSEITNYGVSEGGKLKKKPGTVG
jgi:TP901 family phage tail tape measure protein